MKTFLFLFLLICLNFCSLAQNNFYKLSIGAGTGATFVFSDSKKMKTGLAFNGLAEYYLTPFTNVGIEYQKGKLVAGEAYSRPFENNYYSFFLNGKVQLGEFLNHKQLETAILKKLKGAYIGAGLGAIKSNISLTAPAKEPIIPLSKEIVIPINFGINFHFPDQWGRTRFLLNFNSQTIISLEDGLDGDPNPVSNVNDMYSYISVGLRYNFGVIGLDRRRPGRWR